MPPFGAILWKKRDDECSALELRKDVGADIREIRSDLKLLTGKMYELMGEKH
jgi:hypothetical protein